MYTNNSNLPLSLSVWLAHDDYDHDPRDNHISATSLIKPLKQLIMSNRAEDQREDLVALLPSRIGTAVHNAIESAWVNHYAKNLHLLGYPKKIIDRIRINPTAEELKADPKIIPIYLEQRREKEVDGMIVSGKFDFVGEGKLQDFKYTSVYTYMQNVKDDDYIMQGSIYRWIFEDIIIDDSMVIQFIFKDWQANRIRENGYPQASTHEQRFELWPITKTEAYVRRRIAEIKKFWDAPEEQIPECDDEALWRKPTVYKVYKDATAKRAVSGGVFPEDKRAAQRKANEIGGVIKTFPGEVVACRFCKGFDACKQKDRYLASGELKLRG